MCRSRRELSNEYLLAKLGFDTAANEPCKVCPLSAYRSRSLVRIIIIIIIIIIITDPSGVFAVATFRYNTAKSERSTVASLVIEYNSFTALC